MNKLKKFKTVEELENAYSELEIAFTRKCQESAQAKLELDRLKQEHQDLLRAQTSASKPEIALVGGKEPQNADTFDLPAETAVPCDMKGEEDERECERKACTVFFTAFPEAKDDLDALATELSMAEVIDATAMYRAYATLLRKKLAKMSPKALSEDADFLKSYVYTSPVVRAYFEELLSHDGLPRVLKVRGASILPPVKPQSIADAGMMAKDLF